MAYVTVIKSSANSMNSHRVAELDVLRGIAAVSVMIYHYTNVYPLLVSNEKNSFCVPYGVFAVHLFFIISGFVITISLIKTRCTLDFIVSRFSRLYPVFWVAVLMTQVVVHLSPYKQYSVSWKDALVNLTMIPQVFHVPLVDDVYWSLVIEVVFYVIMLGIWRLGLLDKIEYLVLPWCLFQITSLKLSVIIGHEINQVFMVIFLIKYAHLFLAGILFHGIWQQGVNILRLSLLTVCLATEFIVQGVLAGCFAISFFSLFLLLSMGRLYWLVNKPLLFLGGISYSLYLIHQNIGFEIMLHLDNYPLIIKVILASLCMILLSCFLRYWVELPSIRIIRSLYRKLNSSSKLQIS
jgi:peptidoglycan/LPS O-acetylase OafA/YrhL